MTDSASPSFADQLMKALNWLSIVLGTMSLVSAITRIFSVGLKPVFAHFVEFYRNALWPVYELILLIPFPFQLPLYAIDLMIVYLVLVGMNFRAIFGKRAMRELDGKLSSLGNYYDAGDRRLFIFFWLLEPRNIIILLSLVPLLRLEPVILFIQAKMRHTELKEAYKLAERKKNRVNAEKRAKGIVPFNIEAAGYYEYHDAKATLAATRTDFYMFVAFPLSVIVFFLMNAYLPV